MSSNLRMVGIAGTNGSGKDTVGQILVDGYNYLFVSGSDMLRAECRSRGIAVSRENLRMISAEWRRQHGLGVLIDKAVELFNQSDKTYAGLVIASIRNPGEADRIHELGGKTIWVDADPMVRYERITSGNRGREGEDNKTYEQFLAEENAEMQSTGDVATLNMSAVKELADIFILNQSSEEDLKKTVASELGL